MSSISICPGRRRGNFAGYGLNKDHIHWQSSYIVMNCPTAESLVGDRSTYTHAVFTRLKKRRLLKDVNAHEFVPVWLGVWPNGQ